MPRFKRVQGPSADVVFQRFDAAVPAADGARARAVEISARLEERRSAGLRRERDRLAYKHGVGSEPVKRAEVRVRAHEKKLAELHGEAVRVRIGAVDPGPNAVIIHGRVFDAARKPLPGLTAAIADDSGRLLLATRTDATGYFKLDSASTRPDPKGGKTRLTASMFGRGSPIVTGPGGPKPGEEEPRVVLRLVVLDGERELHREDLAEILPGEARYREIVIAPPGKRRR